MKKVNLGCGLQALPDWINLDISYNIWLSKHPALKNLLYKIGLMDKRSYDHKWPKYIKRYDIRKRLYFEDNSIDFIYTSHFIEHITKEEAVMILKECYRVLKPQGLIRIVVPDLEIYAKRYLMRDLAFFEQKEGECAADRFLISLGLGHQKIKPLSRRLYERFVEDTQHKWMWDFDSLTHTLDSCGFTNIKKTKFRQGRVPDIEILDNRPKESLYVEAAK